MPVNGSFDPRRNLSDVFGFNVGGGVEHFAAEKLAVSGRVNYHTVMMENRNKFGEDFGNQGFLTFGAGVTFYLFTGGE